MSKNIDYYDQNAEDLFAQYENTSFTAVHANWLHLLPKNGQILDIGAGSGRDSAFMAKQGLYVTAVEPSENLRLLASNNHPSQNITWHDDTLPNLTNTLALNKKFDLILLSAVWMHLSEPERKTAMPILCSLLNPDASVVITLRHGKSVDARTMHAVSYDEIKLILDGSDFVCALLSKGHHNADTLGRENVSWQTVQISTKENNE
jgi:2-polyprenyl-3-methyl-5-hydroxy-6-metoxy-1,4-benzoquinol methylase